MRSKKLVVAEHLFTQSYRSLQDPKILISVLKNLLFAIEEVITFHLERARKERRISAYSDTFNGKLTAFKLHLARELEVNPVDFMMIAELQELLEQQARAPTEFRRKHEFIVADENFALHKISPEKTKTYIERTKSFVTRL